MNASASKQARLCQELSEAFKMLSISMSSAGANGGDGYISGREFRITILLQQIGWKTTDPDFCSGCGLPADSCRSQACCTACAHKAGA